MNIDELYRIYQDSKDENILKNLIEQSNRYCMSTYNKKFRKKFSSIHTETGEDVARDVATDQIMICLNKCLELESTCFKKCLSYYFPLRLIDRLRKIIKREYWITGSLHLCHGRRMAGI